MSFSGYHFSPQNSNFQPISSPCTHKLITQILWYTQSIFFFANLTKKMYNFDSFTPDGYCGVDSCHFFYLTIRGRRGQCLCLGGQVLQDLKIPVVHWLETAALVPSLQRNSVPLHVIYALLNTLDN